MKNHRTQFSDHRLRQSDRRGALIVVALVGIVLATAISASLLKSALAEVKLTLREQNRLQSVWLSESGIDRAVARLESDPAYTGETWEIPAELLGAKESGSVEIQVEPAGEENQLQITAVALFPTTQTFQVKTRKSLLLTKEP